MTVAIACQCWLHRHLFLIVSYLSELMMSVRMYEVVYVNEGAIGESKALDCGEQRVL